MLEFEMTEMHIWYINPYTDYMFVLDCMHKHIINIYESLNYFMLILGI